MFSRSGKFFSFSRKPARQKALSRRRAFRRLWMLQQLEQRVVMSWTPLADTLIHTAEPAYCTQAEVSFQTVDHAQAANKFAANFAVDRALGSGRSAAGPASWFGSGAKADPLFPGGAEVDQMFAVAGAPDLMQGDGEATVSVDGSEDTTTLSGSLNNVPSPFWRKTGDQPTFAPDWYANQGAVTHEVFYNSQLTSSENGALLAKLLSNLSAGDHVRIHAGTYSIDSFFLIKAAGTAQQPITIEGAAGEQVTITRSNAVQNTVNVDQTQYLIIEGLTIKGGSTGLKLYSVDHFMLHDVEVRNTANNSIAANSRNTSYLYFVDNNIHHTGGHGEGFYLGAHDASIATHHTYVVGNYIHDLNATSISQGDGIEVKDGSYAVTIKYNYIENTNYPGIIVYRTGRGMTDRNLIEENVVLHSDDVGIQATADAVIRNNLVVSPNAFLSKPFSTNPQNLTVVNNTFVATGDAVRTSKWDETNTFANNAIYSDTQQYVPTGTGSATELGNVLISSLATAFTDLKLDGTALDATPAAGSPLRGAASAAHLPVRDLNGKPRSTAAEAGAVDYSVEQTLTLKQFDFGSATSPLGTGLTRITPASKYSLATGYGWLSGSVYARDRGAPDNLRRDFNFIPSGTMTFGADLPAGAYQVTLVVGDESYATSTTDILMEGTRVDTVSTEAGRFLTKTYVVNVSDGQLTLAMKRVGGSGFSVLNALAIDASVGSVPGVVVNPTSAPSTDELGTTASFTVALSTQPTADVVIGVSSSDATEGTVSATQLTFTASDWDQPQTVTVTGVDDLLTDGDVQYSVVLAAAQSVDSAYSGLNPSDVSMTNVDDEKRLATLKSGFDFGTDKSPVEPGMTRITPANKYSIAAGYGWLEGSVYSRDRGAPDDLRRDFNFVTSRSMTFGVDVPAGTYQVSIVVGDQSYMTSQSAVVLEGTKVDTLPAMKGQFLTKTYVVSVTDGQLTLRMDYLGTSGFTVLNSLAIEAMSGSAAGVVVNPTSGLSTGESGTTASFTVALSTQPTADVVIGVSSSDSTEGTVSATQLTFTASDWDQPQTVTVTGVDDLLTDGDVPYSVVLAAAQSVDSAYSGLNPSDVSLTNTDDEEKAVTPMSGFDFGTDTSPVEPGMKRVTPADKYSIAAGYGWLEGSVYSRDRGAPDDLRRDFNFVTSRSMTFGVDVPAGTYQVSIVVGDQSYMTSQSAVVLEGTKVDTLPAMKGQFLTKTYVVSVTDGQLTLRMDYLGTSGFTVLNSLAIEEVV